MQASVRDRVRRRSGVSLYRVVIATLILSVYPRLLIAQKEPYQGCTASGSPAARLRDRGSALLQQGVAAEALTLLESAHRLCSEDFAITHDLAEAEFVAGQLPVAEKLVEGLLAKKDSPELHNLLGGIKAAMKDAKGAAAQYQIATKMDPDEQNLFDFGTSLMKVDYGAAEKVLAFGIERFPKSVKLHVALGIALYAQDRSLEGAEALCKASALDPQDAHPMEVLADTETIPKSLLPTTVQDLAALHGLYPSNGLILFDLTMAQSGRWSGEPEATKPEFVASLQQAISLDPHLAKAYMALAAVYDDRKDYRQEIATLQQALAIAPKQAQTHYRLAFAYREIGDQQHFREEIERYHALHTEQLMAK